jgi:predicted HTH transcriptional regulator
MLIVTNTESMQMPRFITLAEVAGILQSGDFTRLLGGLEDEQLECKSAPYNLDQEREKMELAKDVSALANADGGIILIGVQTEQEPSHPGDIIRRVRCIAQSRIDFTQYQNVLSDWVLPTIGGLRFEWHANATNRDEGIASILVPLEAARERPCVVTKVVENTGRIVGSYIGFFERTRDNVAPMKPGELRDRLKDGRRFLELDTRLGNIGAVSTDILHFRARVLAVYGQGMFMGNL